jgi:hypothetical protein
MELFDVSEIVQRHTSVGQLFQDEFSCPGCGFSYDRCAFVNMGSALFKGFSIRTTLEIKVPAEYGPMDHSADVAPIFPVESIQEGHCHMVRTVLLVLVVIPFLSPPAENRAHDHHAADIAAARSLARNAATCCKTASRFKYGIILYAYGILNCCDGALAAACNRLFIFEAQGKGTLNGKTFILTRIIHGSDPLICDSLYPYRIILDKNNTFVIQ